MNRKYILVGAKPPDELKTNPGGQLTACEGLIDFAETRGDVIEVLDTTQSSFPVPPLKTRIRRGIHRVIMLWQKLKQNHIEGVIIFSSAGFSFYERIVLSLICRLFKVPSIFFMRSGHFINEIQFSILKKIIAKSLLNIPENIGAQGRGWVEFYDRMGVLENRIVVVRNWLSADFPVAKETKVLEKNARLKFIYVGWLVKEKGVPQLLEASLKLSKKYDFELHLIGGGTLENHCKAFLKNNGLEDYIQVHGWQNKKFIIDKLQSSHVFVLPSEAEGFPNSLLEAIASGLPSICTNVGGVADSLRDQINGYLLKDNSLHNISEAMTCYLENPDLIENHSSETLKIYHALHNQQQNCEILFNQIAKTKAKI